MRKLEYFTIDACIRYGFPFIYRELASTEQAPNYEEEPQGMAELGKILTFVQNDDYYSSFEEKCSYIITGIAGAQHFSNGNKRLSIIVLLMFLQRNEASVEENPETLRSVLEQHFPEHLWEQNPSIQGAHSLFLYNLSVVIGNKPKWGTDSFPQMREKITAMFSFIYSLGS